MKFSLLKIGNQADIAIVPSLDKERSLYFARTYIVHVCHNYVSYYYAPQSFSLFFFFKWHRCSLFKIKASFNAKFDMFFCRQLSDLSFTKLRSPSNQRPVAKKAVTTSKPFDNTQDSNSAPCSRTSCFAGVTATFRGALARFSEHGRLRQ